MLGILLAAAPGCDHQGASSESRDIAHAEEALTGRVDTVAEGGSGDEVCTPFATQRIDRGITISSAVLNSPAFQTCVRERARRYHISCSLDPNWTSSIDAQVTALFNGLRGGNHVRAICNSHINQDSAFPQPDEHGRMLGGDDLKDWGMRRHWTMAHWDGETRARIWDPSRGDPYTFDVSGILHELAHTHGFHHADKDCAFPGACADAACAWTTVCGGSGTPPSRPFAWSDVDGRNRCAAEAGLGDDGYLNGDGDPSFPYILTDCAYQIVSESNQACPGGIFPASCGDDDVQLLSTWDDAAREYTGACGCQPSARHRAAFMAGSGHFLQAFEGGGGSVTAEGIGIGPWQLFYLVDTNGGHLEHDDLIQIRTSRLDDNRGWFVGAGTAAGSAVNATRTSNSSSFTSFRIRRLAGAGRVVDGDVVGLFNVARGRFVTAVDDGGGAVVSDQTHLGDWEQFTYREPRRALLVNVRTHDGRYVSFDPAVSGAVELSTQPFAADINASGNAERDARSQTFWVIDHNGGALRHGDEVSFESSLDMSHWSVCTSRTSGNVRGNSVYASQPCQRFRVDRVAGAGEVRHGDGIRIVSVADNRLLNAVPAGFPTSFRIRNEAVVAGPWERFEIEFVAGRDGDDAGTARDPLRFSVF